MKTENYLCKDGEFKYKGFWTCNGGSTYGHVYGNNKNNVKDDIVKIAAANTFVGNYGKWSISEMINGEDYIVLSGSIKN